MKKVLKIASLIYTSLWFISFAVSVVGKLLYKAPPGTEPLDAFLTQGVYNVLILAAAMGLFSSALLSMCLYAVFGPNVSKLSTLKNVTLGFSVLTNLLFYLSVYLVFIVNRDAVLVVPIMWILCAVICLVLLIVVMANKGKKLTDHCDVGSM